MVTWSLVAQPNPMTYSSLSFLTPVLGLSLSVPYFPPMDFPSFGGCQYTYCHLNMVPTPP